MNYITLLILIGILMGVIKLEYLVSDILDELKKKNS
jgi:hypothetical protein